MEARNSMDRKCHGLKITEEKMQVFIQNTAQRDKGECEQAIIEHKIYTYGRSDIHSFIFAEGQCEGERGTIVQEIMAENFPEVKGCNP